MANASPPAPTATSKSGNSNPLPRAKSKSPKPRAPFGLELCGRRREAPAVDLLHRREATSDDEWEYHPLADLPVLRPFQISRLWRRLDTAAAEDRFAGLRVLPPFAARRPACRA